MAAGWVSALSFSFVLVVFGCYKAVNQVNHNPPPSRVLPSGPLYFHCHVQLLKSSAGRTGLTCDGSMSDVWTACLLHSFWAGFVHWQACAQTLGLPKWFIWTFRFPLKWHHRSPAWLMSLHLQTLLCPKRRQNIWNTEGFVFYFVFV